MRIFPLSRYKVSSHCRTERLGLNRLSNVLQPWSCLAVCLLMPALILAQVTTTQPQLDEGQKLTYQLGPEDQIAVRVQDLEKLQLENTQAPKIDVNGNLSLPIVGRIHAQGLTLNQLEAEIASRLSNILQNPSVSVSIVQYRSHPVSVLGAVRNPGVLQITPHRRLLDVISMANGLAPDAGDKVIISRRKSMGPLPLPHTVTDSGSDVSVGQIEVRPLLQGADPELNIEICEHDVITISRAEMIFVVGAVKRAGGFTLGEKEQMSVLQALSLAEGLMPGASPKNARLLREELSGKERKEILLNIKPILVGAAPDLPLRANDILFIPTNATKQAAIRSMEMAIQLGTGALMRY